MCSSAHPWRRLRLWTINMNDQHEIIRKQWKPRYVLALLEFVQECLLRAVVESNKQVRWLKYGKLRWKQKWWKRRYAVRVLCLPREKSTYNNQSFSALGFLTLLWWERSVWWLNRGRFLRVRFLWVRCGLSGIWLVARIHCGEVKR